ncbi:hypothetical protein HH308_18065 [Gordonia sp. TBRC 11910]|uniref:Uncharacterized protein n=1 Tax=Gordonia asplenii TaxID=2725283 RepID=A0A848L3G9_9ACTN|nr:hypothetical protein [Gordonia asplenii]NMO03121.1 hypothetical protein [Gordonia asplenii]
MNVFMVKCVDPSDLSVFGVKVERLDVPPMFKHEAGILWRSAVWICVYDDGRMYA